MWNSLPTRHPRLAHLAAWLAAGLVYLLAVLPFYGGAIPKMVAFKSGWSVIGWLIGESLLRTYRRLDLSGRRPGAMAAWVVATSVAVGGLWVGVMAAISIAVQGNTLLVFTPVFFPFVLMNHVFILLAWSGGYLTVGYWRRAKDDERRLVEARSEARGAQIELLRLQLSPHFLFNSLASLRALIGEDPERARGMVTRLSAFLRYALGTGDRVWVTVREELEVLGTYLEIERIRFGERLEVCVTCDDAAAERPIPGLLLLSLVENAVKHGAEVDGVLRVEITAGVAGGALSMLVRNTGRLEGRAVNGAGRRAPTDDRSGFGLRNVRERLESAYGAAASLTLAEGDGTVDARIDVRA